MITIYGTRGCGFCKTAVEKCRKNRLKYEYKDASIVKYYKELQAFGVDTRSMPHVFVNEQYLGSYHNLIEYIQKTRIK